jgi:hypothetical protein
VEVVRGMMSGGNKFIEVEKKIMPKAIDTNNRSRRAKPRRARVFKILILKFLFSFFWVLF